MDILIKAGTIHSSLIHKQMRLPFELLLDSQPSFGRLTKNNPQDTNPIHIFNILSIICFVLEKIQIQICGSSFCWILKFSCVLSNKKIISLPQYLSKVWTQDPRRANNFFQRLPEWQVDYMIVVSVTRTNMKKRL